MYYGWKPYVPVAERRRKAERDVQKLAKKGRVISPVVIEGRVIARTFWGKAWCENLERYSDFANRLPRGRTYVRNGSVLDLQISAGQVEALVSGSELYQVTVAVKSVSKGQWTALCGDCAGAVDSLVELLQGRFSKGVMERICRPGTGLFPAPSEIGLACSCPDWASMCKHVAAVLYGIGARLDAQPELLFRLRGVDPADLLAKAAGALPLAKHAPAPDKVLAGDDLSDLFGLDLAGSKAVPAAKESSRNKPSKPPAKAKAGSTAKSKTPSAPRKTKPPVKKVVPKAEGKTPIKAAPKAQAKTVARAKPKGTSKPRVKKGVLG